MADGNSGLLSPIENAIMPVAAAIPLPQLKVWLSAYFHPVETFESEQAKLTGGIGGYILKNLVSIGLLFGVILGIVGAALMLFIGNIPGALMFFAFALVGGVLDMLILIPIGSGIYWVIAKILGGKGALLKQLMGMMLIVGGAVFLTLPFQILQAIPVVGIVFGFASILVWLYSVYSQYRLIKSIHCLSPTKAAAVIIIPYIILVIVLGAAILSILALFGLGGFIGK